MYFASCIGLTRHVCHAFHLSIVIAHWQMSSLQLQQAQGFRLQIELVNMIVQAKCPYLPSMTCAIPHDGMSCSAMVYIVQYSSFWDPSFAINNPCSFSHMHECVCPNLDDAPCHLSCVQIILEFSSSRLRGQSKDSKHRAPNLVSGSSF